ncbi:MAG: cupin domain-containing protein [Candidatus Limnocylindria bacterium]
MTDPRRARHLEPGAGRSVTLYNVRFTSKVEAEDTGGAVAVLETVIPPRTLVKPHQHEREDEFSFVVSGTLGVRLGSQEDFEARAGSYLIKPRGVPHAVWNRSAEPVTMLEILSPAGFERYFEEMAPVLREHGPEWTAKFYELAERYGVTVLDDWSDELQERYGVKLDPPSE